MTFVKVTWCENHKQPGCLISIWRTIQFYERPQWKWGFCICISSPDRLTLSKSHWYGLSLVSVQDPGLWLARTHHHPLIRGWGKLWQGRYNFSDSSISYLQTPALHCPCLGNLQIEITFKPDSYCQGCQYRRWGEFIWLIYLNEVPLGIQATLGRMGWGWPAVCSPPPLTWCCGGRSPRWPRSRWRCWPCSTPPRPHSRWRCPWSTPDMTLVFCSAALLSTSWGGTPSVIVLKSTFWYDSMQGRTKNIPDIENGCLGRWDPN